MGFNYLQRSPVYTWSVNDYYVRTIWARFGHLFLQTVTEKHPHVELNYEDCCVNAVHIHHTVCSEPAKKVNQLQWPPNYHSLIELTNQVTHKTWTSDQKEMLCSPLVFTAYVTAIDLVI